MDELENKNDNLSADGEEKNAQETSGELEKELEDIREMFQNELDKATEENSAEEGSGEMLIQELDEIEEEAEEASSDEIPEDELCQCCGERRRASQYGEDYPYCEECRKLMKANPFNLLGIIMVVAMIVVAGFAIGNMANYIDDYVTLITADTAYNEKKLVDAAAAYQNYLSSKGSNDSVSAKAVKNAADAMASLGYYENANSYIGAFLSEAQLKMPWNKKYVEIQSRYNVLTKTSELINENFSEALNGSDFDYEKEIKKADALIEEYKDNEEYSLTFLEYVKYLLMLTSEQDMELQLDQLKKIDEIDGGKESWIYITYLLNAYASAGDVENAKAVFERCLEYNLQDMTVYNYYSNVYRFCDHVDADKILEIAQQAEENYSNSSYPVFYRTYAIAYLLKGDADKAASSIEQYLSNCQATVSDYNLYALCAIAKEDDEIYNSAKDTLETYGYDLSASVKKCKKGKLTIEQVITDKEANV